MIVFDEPLDEVKKPKQVGLPTVGIDPTSGWTDYLKKY
jgi:hypothetical protein